MCCLPLPACGDTLEVAAFNASSWWHQVDSLGQERAWVAERAALGTAGHSWAAEPGSEAAWLELDLGARRNITGERRPSDWGQQLPWSCAALTTVLAMVTWVPASLIPPPPKQNLPRAVAIPPVTPRRHWSSLCHGFTGVNWDAASTNPPGCPCPPTSAALSGMNKLILCSCIWCQPVAFVRPEPAQSGGFVRQRLVTTARKMGTLSGRRLEEGGMWGWQLGPEVISSCGAEWGVPYSNLPPKPPSQGWRDPLGVTGVTCPPQSPPSRDLGISEMGAVLAGKALRAPRGPGRPPQALPQPCIPLPGLTSVPPGIITTGSSELYDYYVTSYRLSSSRDGKNWRPYRGNGGQEDKVGTGAMPHDTAGEATDPLPMDNWPSSPSSPGL